MEVRRVWVRKKWGEVRILVTPPCLRIWSAHCAIDRVVIGGVGSSNV